MNFINKTILFQARRSHGHTCDRDHFKLDAEEKQLIISSSLTFLSKNPLFKGVSKDSSLTSSLTYLSLISHMIPHLLSYGNSNQIR